MALQPEISPLGPDIARRFAIAAIAASTTDALRDFDGFVSSVSGVDLTSVQEGLTRAVSSGQIHLEPESQPANFEGWRHYQLDVEDPEVAAATDSDTVELADGRTIRRPFIGQIVHLKNTADNPTSGVDYSEHARSALAASIKALRHPLG